MRPSGTLRIAIEAARKNAAKRGHRKVLPLHVAEEILKTDGGKTTLKEINGEIDPKEILHDIQEAMSEGPTGIAAEEVALDDPAYERLMAIAEGKAMSNNRDRISPRCVLAAMAAMTKTPLFSIFSHYELTEEALDAVITRVTPKSSETLVAEAALA